MLEKMLSTRMLAGMLAGVGVMLAVLTGCGRSDDAETVPPLPRPGEIQTPSTPDPLGFEYKLGSADQCELLLAADPAGLLETEIGPEFRTYGLCRYEAKVWRKGEPERAVGLEMRREPQRPVPTNMDDFWAREGGGVGLMGGKREEVVMLSGIGDYALWYPTARGLQMYAFWDTHNILLITIAGATVEKSLPWAQELAKKAIAQASAGSDA
jgi:hypothetical protein